MPGPVTRTIANVLLDLRQVRREHEGLNRAYQAADGDRKREDELGDKMSALDDRTNELREEFASLFHDATGVQWEQVEEAIHVADL